MLTDVGAQPVDGNEPVASLASVLTRLREVVAGVDECQWGRATASEGHDVWELVNHVAAVITASIHRADPDRPDEGDDVDHIGDEADEVLASLAATASIVWTTSASASEGAALRATIGELERCLAHLVAATVTPREGSRTCRPG